MLLLLLGGFASCGGDLNPEDEGNYRHQKVKDKPVMKTIRLQFGGDYVSESEEPLLRAEDGNTYVGINVFRKENDDDDTNYEMYAYGMFIGKDGLNINVLTGYTYRFEASILIEEKDKLALNGIRYNEPFEVHEYPTTGFDNAWGYEVRNVYEVGRDDLKFQYANEDPNKANWYLCELQYGTAYVDCQGELVDRYGSTLSAPHAMHYPRVKRFYGTADFNPLFQSTVEIPMEYKSFGLKFILESIPAGTNVSITDITEYPENRDNKLEYYLLFPGNLRLSLDPGEISTWESLYSLNTLNNPNQKFKLRFTWNKGNGEAPETFEHDFTVTAKQKKVLKLNIDGDVNETKSGNIIFTQLDDTLVEEEPENVPGGNFKK